MMTFKLSEKNFLAFLIFSLAVSTKFIPSFFESLTADACIYLDIGRNLFSGRGFSLSYNLYQFWEGRVYYPALPLWPPLFPLIAGFIWKIFHSIQSTILLNVVIAGINSVLFFYIIEIIYDNIDISFWAAFLFSFSLPMQQTSMFAWSEQLSLLSVLLALLVYLKDPTLKPLSMNEIGIIFGIGSLIRFDAVFSLLGVVLFVLLHYGFNRKSFLGCLHMFIGFSVIFLPYELFCILRYKLLYPAYLKTVFVGYSKAIFMGGYYDITKIPVLRANIVTSQLNFSLAMENFLRAINMFSREMIKSFNFLIYFLVLRVYLLFKNNYFKEKLLFILGAVSILTRVPSLYYPIDISRFSLIHFACFIPLGIAGFYDICNYLKRYFLRYYRIVYFLGILIISLSMGRFLITLHGNYFKGAIHFLRQENSQRQKFFTWLRNRTKQDQLIAIPGDLIQVAFTLDRPIVSLPVGKVLNLKNFKDFLDAFKPLFIAIDSSDLGIYKDFILPFSEEIVVEENWHQRYHVFKVDYNKLSGS